MSASDQIAEIARDLRALSLAGLAYRAECAAAVARQQEQRAEAIECNASRLVAAADAGNVVVLRGRGM